jgi:hypothetical protein
MKQVTQDQWADHVSNFRTYQTESIFRNGVSWMNSLISPDAPKDQGPPRALVGRVEYRPDGSKVYFIC